MALTAEQLDAFEADGFVVVPGAFARADAAAMEDAWWAELKAAYGSDRDDRSTWRQQRGDLRAAKTDPLQRRIETPLVRAIIDDLLGEGAWDPPNDWGRPIVTFPSGAPLEAWDVVTGLWHWDGQAAWNVHGPTSLFVVSFVGRVEPGGGGTLVLAGSPRLILRQYEAEGRDVRGDETCRRDRFHVSCPWLAALTGHAPSPKDRVRAFMGDGACVDGVDLRVVELTGEGGDMVFCHPLLAHAVSPNHREVPRMMRIKQQLMSHEGRRLIRGVSPGVARPSSGSRKRRAAGARR